MTTQPKPPGPRIRQENVKDEPVIRAENVKSQGGPEFDEKAPEIEAKKLEGVSSIAPFIRGARWQHQQLMPRVAALEAELEDLRRTEKVYRMNRDWIADAKKTITALESEVARLREALEFYADDGNWAFTPSKETNLWAATTILDDSSACDSLTGGKRAREALSGREEGGE